MNCPIVRKRNGRMVLGVLVIGTMIYQPPKSAGDVALYGLGTIVGLMITDNITSGNSLNINFGLGGGRGCGCG
jgi:hypothetical protein